MLRHNCGVVLSSVFAISLWLMPSARAGHVVQVGAFRNLSSAASIADGLRQEGYSVEVVSDGLHRVFVGPFVERSAAEAALAKLKAQGRDAFLRSDSAFQPVAPPRPDQRERASAAPVPQSVTDESAPREPSAAGFSEPDSQPATFSLDTLTQTGPAARESRAAVGVSGQTAESSKQQGQGNRITDPAIVAEASPEPVRAATATQPTGAAATPRRPASQRQDRRPEEPPVRVPDQPVAVAEQSEQTPRKEESVLASANPPEPRPVEPARSTEAIVIPRHPETTVPFNGPERGTVDISALGGLWAEEGGQLSFGGSVGAHLNSRLLVLGEFAYIPLGGASVDTDLGRSSVGARVLVYGLAAQYNFHLANSRFVPYVTGGGGAWNASVSASDPLAGSLKISGTVYRTNFGGGARYYFSERWGVRPDLRVYIGGGSTDFHLGAGVFYQIP